MKYPDRPRLMKRYRDPESGEQIARSTGITKQRDAERAATKWEAELREGGYNKQATIAWRDNGPSYDHSRPLHSDDTLGAASHAYGATESNAAREHRNHSTFLRSAGSRSHGR